VFLHHFRALLKALNDAELLDCEDNVISESRIDASKISPKMLDDALAAAQVSQDSVSSLYSAALDWSKVCLQILPSENFLVDNPMSSVGTDLRHRLGGDC